MSAFAVLCLVTLLVVVLIGLLYWIEQAFSRQQTGGMSRTYRVMISTEPTPLTRVETASCGPVIVENMPRCLYRTQRFDVTKTAETETADLIEEVFTFTPEAALQQHRRVVAEILQASAATTLLPVFDVEFYTDATQGDTEFRVLAQAADEQQAVQRAKQELYRLGYRVDQHDDCISVCETLLLSSGLYVLRVP